MPKVKTEYRFPIVAQSKHSDLVVQFSAKRAGIVITGDRFWKKGHRGLSWTSVFDEKHWSIVSEADPNDKLVILKHRKLKIREINNKIEALQKQINDLLNELIKETQNI